MSDICTVAVKGMCIKRTVPKSRIQAKKLQALLCNEGFCDSKLRYTEGVDIKLFLMLAQGH
jgi:hypothetical protein